MHMYEITDEDKLNIISSRIAQNRQSISLLEKIKEQSVINYMDKPTIKLLDIRINELKNNLLTLIKTRLSLKQIN